MGYMSELTLHYKKVVRMLPMRSFNNHVEVEVGRWPEVSLTSITCTKNLAYVKCSKLFTREG